MKPGGSVSVTCSRDCEFPPRVLKIWIVNSTMAFGGEGSGPTAITTVTSGFARSIDSTEKTVKWSVVATTALEALSTRDGRPIHELLDSSR